MISWTDEAIEAANALLNREWAAGIPDDLMRRALDAAVKAQLGEKVGLLEGFTRNSWDDARAEALEEAAALCACRCNEIRALKETKGAS